jgi:hypothetical protein
MKPAQQRKGVTEKKPADLTLGAPSTTAVTETSQAKSAHGSPSAAVWTRYIDSRMKQFGTR